MTTPVSQRSGSTDPSRTADRCAMLDTLRGFTVINMILYHAVWDLVYLFGMDWEWYHGTAAYAWQQWICCTFILLSGFCSGMGRHTVRRGGVVFLLGAGITLVTVLCMPDEQIWFGVLTLIGSSMLLVGLCKPFLTKIPAVAGGIVSLLLFGFTRHVNRGFLGIWKFELIRLPDWLYQNYATAYLGFPQTDFYSTDYFALLPWLFLFLTGFFVYQMIGKIVLSVRWKGIPGLNFIGRHALECYIVHQPAVYGLLYVWHLLQ